MKLYEYESFPSPRRVRVFLAEKGAEVPRVQIDVPAGEHRREPFLRKNRFATVPTLELDDGTFLGDTVSISRYFEELHPEPPLMAVTAKEKAEIAFWQRRVEQSLFGAVNAYFHHATPGLGELETYQNEDWGEKNGENAVAAMRELDTQLVGRPFIAGDSFSIADITGLCAVDFAKSVGISIPEDCSHLKRWYANVSSRPSARA